MMPTFPSPSLKFRTVSFPQYGFKVGLSDGAFPNHAQYHVAQFASVLRALRFHRRIPRTVPRDGARLSTSVRAAFTALPQGSSLRPGFYSPGHHHLIDPIRPTRRLVTISLPGRLYATSLLCRVNWPKLMTSGSRLSLPFPLDMPPSTTPGSSVSQWSSLATPTWAFALAERDGTPKFPAIRFSQARIFGASWFASAAACQVARPLCGSVRALSRPPRLLLPGFRRVGRPSRRWI
jgi:hypothetical protein